MCYQMNEYTFKNKQKQNLRQHKFHVQSMATVFLYHLTLDRTVAVRLMVVVET